MSSSLRRKADQRTHPALVFIPDGELAHLLQALENYRGWCRSNAYPWTAWRDDLMRSLVALYTRLDPSTLDGLPSPLDSRGMDTTPTLAYDLEEVARLLSVSLSTVERLVASDELRSIKIGKARRVTREDLEAWLDTRRADTTGPEAHLPAIERRVQPDPPSQRKAI